jgi:hypothetical protein
MPHALRALLLVPLLAVAADQTRAALFCAPGAQSCLEAAGRGSLGAAGIALLCLYAAAVAVLVARLARQPWTAAARPGRTVRLWLIGSAGVAALAVAQAVVAGSLADPAALGGGWVELLGLCAASGGVIALALRAAPAAAALVRDLRPAAPRPALLDALACAFSAPAFVPARAPRSPATAGRAPPAR